MDKFGRSIEVFNKPIKFWRDKSVGKKAIVIQKHVRGWMRVYYLLPDDVNLIQDLLAVKQNVCSI